MPTSRRHRGTTHLATGIMETVEGVFKGAVDKLAGFLGAGMSRQTQWKQLDQMFDTRGEVSSSLLTIAGYVVSRGYITIPASSDSKAQEAKTLCDQYAFDNDLDNVIFEGTVNLGLHGTVFVENNFVGKKLVGSRVFPWQEQVQPATMQRDGRVKTWKQVIGISGKAGATWKAGEIVPIALPPKDSEGFGRGLVNSVRGVLEVRRQLDMDIKDYIHKTAFPMELFAAGDQSEKVDKKTADDLYAKVRNWKPGQKVVTNYPVTYQATGVGNVESRMFPELIRVVRDSCVDGLLVPPISYQRNSTEASSRAMIGNMRIAIIQPIQRLWKRAVETGIFKPLLLGEGYDEEKMGLFLPRITFMPPTEEEMRMRTDRVITAYTANGRVAAVEQIISKDEARVELDMPPAAGEQQTQKPQQAAPEPAKPTNPNPEDNKKVNPK